MTTLKQARHSELSDGARDNMNRQQFRSAAYRFRAASRFADSESQKFEDLVWCGLCFRRSGDATQAATIYTTVLSSSFPQECQEAHEALGDIAFENKAYGDAISHFSQALAIICGLGYSWYNNSVVSLLCQIGNAYAGVNLKVVAQSFYKLAFKASVRGTVERVDVIDEWTKVASGLRLHWLRRQRRIACK